MTQATDPISNHADAEEVRQQLKGKHVCPFCGVIRADAGQPCPRCTMEDTASTRQGTRQRIGPWYVMQARNPSAPGMKFATMISVVKKGHVTARSIVRGPTTHQLWTFAAKVKGLSRELGICYHCGEAIETSAASCTRCGKTQEPPADPDALLESSTAHAGAPELTLSSGLSADGGMDGGTSLDLQLDDVPGLTAKPPRPAKPQTPPSTLAMRPGSPANERGRQEEAILSARELAAAFQLDFKPKQPAAALQRKAAAPKPAPVAKPTPKQPAPVIERKPVRLFKTLAMLIGILIVAAAIVFAIRPDWRTNFIAWANTSFDSVKKSLDTPAKSAKPTPAPVAEAKPAVKPTVVERTTPPANVVEVKPEPKPEPVVQRPIPKPEPLPEPIRVVESNNDANLTLDQAINLGRDLRNRALDASGRGDWTIALALYQRIERLPRDAWPNDLLLQITKAKKALGQ